MEIDEWEIWAYYSYYIGDNGLGGFNFAPTAFQNLLYQAGGETGVFEVCWEVSCLLILG
jgi:hypothetical protein